MNVYESNQPAQNMKNSLTNVVSEFEAAADFLSLTKEQRAFIKEPRFSVRLKLPVQMDNGQIKIVRAYHTIHSITRGPSIGGIQFRPGVDWNLVEALAFWSTHRCALLNIPFGGSYGAVDCEPSMYSSSEIERLSRRYMSEISQLVSPDNDILTADIGTNQQIMSWFMDTYSRHRRDFIPSVALDKPIGLGGTSFTVYPTTAGADLCIRKACNHIGLDLKGAKIAIQGFGKVGSNLAQLLHKSGAKIIAIADISGAYLNEEGISVDEVIWHQQSYGILDGLEGEVDVKKMDNPLDLFGLPIDILIPAAVELQITEENMFDVKAKIIAEVAHDPVSPIADKYLCEKGVLNIPDILCNSGGIIGRYLEWVQNKIGYYWPAERIDREIRSIMEKAFDNVIETSAKRSIPLRLAAAVLAVERIARAAQFRGLYA